ncbi:hypothetical protein [Rhizobacter sp. Root404]|uniref:hypothetical protein n=1 Tax=Rhizobacter sp. Root404 TaxID=1736528 RepID=UPI000700026E|nr:hypothetical protein [Rhizobacter sp. Root404]KQW35265.1 hypothetical protein ASC76_23130 [Rhizobacter sp. Root404]
MLVSTGQIAFILLAALLLACASAWALARRYRSAMRRLMSAPATLAVDDAAPIGDPEAAQTRSPPFAASFADNRRAAARLTLWLGVMSVLIAASSATLWLLLAFPGEPFAPKRAAVLALMHLWPVIPAIGLMHRWSWPRLLGALALWVLFCFAVMLWRSIEPRPLELLLALAVEIGPGLAIVALIFGHSATRAAAPWLLPLFMLLMWVSMAGVDVLALLVERRSPWIASLPGWLGAPAVIALFALLPWLLAWWPVQRLGRWLARAYARKQLSDLMVMFGSVWAISQLLQALSVASHAGVAGIAMLLPLAWVPLAMAIYARAQAAPAHPPTLLVLRVFQHDAQVQALFDHVIERWRLSGPTVLIAGTDLADRTLDADDLFVFLDGDLASRFIRTPAEVPLRLAAFDPTPDADRRYRVNECYCHDSTWQHALRALVHRSDVVLMDLRGFQARNAGCVFELETLARAPRPLRVVVLIDGTTDRAAAAEAAAGAPPGRFHWVETPLAGAAPQRAVLPHLFGAAA